MSDLTDRMRTCAATIVAGEFEYEGKLRAMYDAADLLIEAAEALEPASDPLGEPMALLEPLPPPRAETYKATWVTEAGGAPQAVWTAGDLPAVPTGKPSHRHPRVCPNCDSRATKRVYRDGNKVMLACPACAHAWEYRP